MFRPNEEERDKRCQGLDMRRLSEALGVTPAGVHFASVRGEAFVMEDGKFEKSLRSYLNNLSTSP